MKKISLKIALFVGLCLPFSAYSQLFIGATASVTSNKATITLDRNSLINNGTLTSNNGSTLLLKGSGAATIEGTKVSNLNNLTIDKISGISVNTNAQISNDITLTNGIVTLNNAILTLTGAGKIVNETETARFTSANEGKIAKTEALNSPNAVNIGNLGLDITATTNLGVVTVTRGHLAQTGARGGTGIKRYFDVTAANAAGLNATLTFRYFDAELNNNTESALLLWRQPDGNPNWQNIGADTKNATINTLTKSGIAAFSRWTLAQSILSSTHETDIIQKVEAFPNPTNDVLNLSFNSKKASETEIRIFDATGRTISSEKYPLSIGDNFVIKNVKYLPTGHYFLQILFLENGSTKNLKFEKF
ncbi:MAG: T9SS type A sorting domain-containing protein [Saprospiraceae bacterium]|nr:T9SS type A sorting domain-containing protein [Saprospiraceae bacterium]